MCPMSWHRPDVLYVADTNNHRIQKFVDPAPPPDRGPGGGGGGGRHDGPEHHDHGGPKKQGEEGQRELHVHLLRGRLDLPVLARRRPFEPCTSPEDVKVKKGKHTFEVRATDAAGNTDPTPATQSWTVKKKKKKK